MDKKIILYCLSILLITSCSEMNDIISNYLDSGEIVYLGRVDSLKAYAGKERIHFSWMVGIDSRIEACKICWNNDSDSIIVPIDRNKIVDGIYEAILPIDEGSYVFNLYHVGDGPQSIKREVIANSYGEIYSSNLRTRTVINMNASQQEVEIIWGESETSLNTLFKYKNKDGEEKTLIVLPTVQTTVIDDYVCGGEYTAMTYFLPEEMAIDTFIVTSMGNFPDYYELNRSGWTAQGDTETNLFPSSNILDGNTSSLWHSQWDPEKPFPHELVVDMQNVKNINKIVVLRDHSRCHLKTTHILISNDQTEWTEIGTVEFEDNKTAVGHYLELEQTQKGRYIKLCMTESYRGALVDVAEVYVYGSEILQKKR